ncbi:MAG: non-heme iron oxygenase ferredoxin subunit [Dehalococcoidia bacterium]|nr:non-heme iron oxygenase ferredoxin subunit [Dehalococcoidia bacterium]
MPKTVHIARVDELQPGQMKAVDVDDKHIAVANLGGSYFAFDAICTHAGAALDEGEIDGETVVCPMHGGQFNIKTGGVESPPPKKAIAVYQVKVVGEDIHVEVP